MSSKTPLRLLLVEDSENDATLLLRELNKGPYEITHERVQTAEAMTAALDSKEWDIVISDFNMPRFSAFGALSILKEKKPNLPFLIVSGAIGEDTAVEAMRAGAHDYLMKGKLLRLLPAIERELREAEVRADRKRAESELVISKERYERATRAGQVGIWDWNLRTGESYFSPSLRSLLGYSPEELPNEYQRWQELVHPEDKERVDRALRAHIAGAEPSFGVEVRRRHKNGRYRWFFSQGAVMRDEAGEPARITGSETDITERKAYEMRLIQQSEEIFRSNRELEQFAFISSHDLQEPLRQLANYTELLGQEYREKLEGDGQRYMEIIISRAKRMSDLIKAVRTFSEARKNALVTQEVDLGSVLAQAKKDLDDEIKQGGAKLSHRDLPIVKADAGQMHQLFYHLLSNALKFRSDAAPDIRMSGERKGEEWLISVHDNGLGIEPQYAEKIFRIFQQLNSRDKYPGTGMGLALCKKIMERHGGKIWVERADKQGSIFRFSLPVAGPTSDSGSEDLFKE